MYHTIKRFAPILLTLSLVLVCSHTAAKEFETKEEVKAHNAKCSALKGDFASARDALKPNQTGMKNARKALRKSTQAYQRAYQQYVGFRNTGDTAGAKAAALEVDKHWAEAGKHHQTAINYLDEGAIGRSEGSRFCRAWYAWQKGECMKAEYASNPCSSVSFLAKWRTVYKKPDIANKNYGKTWRQPQDYIFEEPEVAADPTANPLADPRTAGYVIIVHGRAFIERGIRTLPATVGSILHKHDKINVEEGSQAEIMIMGAGSIKITELTSFQIPDTTKASTEEKSVFQKLMKKFDEATKKPKPLNGTPTATAGVRG